MVDIRKVFEKEELEVVLKGVVNELKILTKKKVVRRKSRGHK